MSITETRADRYSKGLCIHCGIHQPQPNKKSCSACLNKISVYNRTRRKSLKPTYRKQGRCGNCGADSPNSFYCATCRETRKRHINKKRLNRAKNSKCKQCGSDSLPNKLCRQCCAKATYYRHRCKLIVIDHYGNKCSCCGETYISFLTIDHINNDGAAHRRSLFGTKRKGGGTAFYRWLINNNFPEGFQVLCANCQLSKQIDGICFHQSLHVFSNGTGI